MAYLYASGDHTGRHLGKVKRKTKGQHIHVKYIWRNKTWIIRRIIASPEKWLQIFYLGPFMATTDIVTKLACLIKKWCKHFSGAARNNSKRRRVKRASINEFVTLIWDFDFLSNCLPGNKNKRHVPAQHTKASTRKPKSQQHTGSNAWPSAPTAPNNHRTPCSPCVSIWNTPNNFAIFSSRQPKSFASDFLHVRDVSVLFCFSMRRHDVQNDPFNSSYVAQKQ